MDRCRDCEQDLWHCHGTLVRHTDGTVECCDETCPDVHARHAFELSCADIAPSCCAGVAATSLTGLARGA